MGKNGFPADGAQREVVKNPKDESPGRTDLFRVGKHNPLYVCHGENQPLC